MKFHPIQICGHEWKVALASDEYLEKYSGDTVAGYTVSATHTIFINYDDLNIDTIIHELCHAFYHYTCVGAAGLCKDQIEEVWCELVSIHYKAIGSLAEAIYKLLKKDL